MAMNISVSYRKEKEMNSRNEKGVVGADVVVGILIFLIGSVSALFLYSNMYTIITQLKINEEIIGCITDIFEKVDDELYEDIDEQGMQEIITAANVPEEFDIQFTITNYKDTVDSKRADAGTTGEEVEDLVKRVTLNVKYSIDKIDRNYTISRIKVKEL